GTERHTCLDQLDPPQRGAQGGVDGEVPQPGLVSGQRRVPTHGDEVPSLQPRLVIRHHVATSEREADARPPGVHLLRLTTTEVQVARDAARASRQGEPPGAGQLSLPSLKGLRVPPRTIPGVGSREAAARAREEARAGLEEAAGADL